MSIDKESCLEASRRMEYAFKILSSEKNVRELFYTKKFETADRITGYLNFAVRTALTFFVLYSMYLVLRTAHYDMETGSPEQDACEQEYRANFCDEHRGEYMEQFCSELERCMDRRVGIFTRLRLYVGTLHSAFFEELSPKSAAAFGAVSAIMVYKSLRRG